MSKECEGWALHSAMAIADKRPHYMYFSVLKSISIVYRINIHYIYIASNYIAFQALTLPHAMAAVGHLLPSPTVGGAGGSIG